MMLETKNVKSMKFHKERGYVEIEEDVTFDSNPTVAAINMMVTVVLKPLSP